MNVFYVGSGNYPLSPSVDSEKVDIWYRIFFILTSLSLLALIQLGKNWQVLSQGYFVFP
jgi:hypothetical protein